MFRRRVLITAASIATLISAAAARAADDILIGAVYPRDGLHPSDQAGA